MGPESEQRGAKVSTARGFAERLAGLLVAATVLGGAMVAGASPASAVGAPDPPTGVSALDGPADGQASVSFTPAATGTPAVGYTATSTPGGLQSSGCTGSPCTVSGLTDGTSYTFTVHAMSPGGSSAESSASNSVTPAPVPTITSFNPSPTQNYGTQQQLSATSAAGTVTFSSTTPATCTISATGLVTAVAQGTCTAHADLPATTSHPAAATVSKNITIVAVQPGAPTGVVATAGNASATVAFTPPASNGGAAITGYTATSSPGGAHSAGCTTSPCAVAGLTNGTLYSFTVTATNGATPSPLTGVASAPSNTVRPGITPQSINFANPGTQTFGSSPQLTATASSGLPVTFTSTTTSVCTVTTAGKLTFVTVGTCTIDADQSGDSTHQSAPTVARTFTVQKASPSVTVTAGVNPSVYGQPITFTATVANPVASGQVQWSVDGINSGAPVTLNGAGAATFSPATSLSVGMHTVNAAYSGNVNDNAANGHLGQVVNKANTSTVLQVSGNTLTATVSPVAPGAGTPTGSVTFTVGGATVGSSALNGGGVATFTASNVGNQGAAAYYDGDTNFAASNGHRTPIGPTVVTHVTSAYSKHNGWYRAPVYVSFTCTPNTGRLTSPCPSTVALAANGAGQSVTRTVTASDGGSTTVTVSPINIDRIPPTVTVRRRGATVRCHAHDGLSGGASCTVFRHTSTRSGVTTVHWRVVAHDRAGNVTVRRGHFAL